MLANRLAPQADGRNASAGASELRQLVRFVIAGAVNTALSIIVYQLALFAFDYTASYVIAYVTGIAVAFYAYARHVFYAPMSAGRFAAFAAFYVLSLLGGGLVNAILVEHLQVAARLAIFATVAIMLPVNYVGSKLCLRGIERRSAAPNSPADRRD